MYYFIINKTGGGGKSIKRWKKLEPFLIKNNIEYKAVFSEHIKHAQEITSQLCSQTPDGSVTNLIIIGGDGTINEVLNGITDFNKIKIGVIPAGSGNDFSRQFKIPRHNPKKAFKKIHNSISGRKIDIGSAEFTSPDGAKRNLLFSISSGLGFDALICEKNESSRIKKALNKLHIGKFSYLAITLQTLFMLRTCGITLKPEGEENIYLKKAIFLAAMNFKAEGGGVKMSPQAVEDDGMFTICSAYNIPKFILLFKLGSLMLGLHTKSRGFFFKNCSNFSVETEEPVTIHTDGEFFTGIRKISYKCLKGRLNVLI